MTLPAIRDHRILIVGGSGGVGKTSVSAALAMLCALEGHRTLVLTIDPARRLAGALGLKGIGRDAVDVTPKLVEAGLAPKGQMFAMMLDVQNTFDRLVERYSPNLETQAQIQGNRLYKNISTRLSGSQEYASMQRLYEIATEDGYDRIILDTPPTTHALDFLTAPKRLMEFFDSRVMQIFVNFGGSVGWNLFRRGTDVFFKALERLTGSGLISEISDFFRIAETVLEPYQSQAGRAEALLRDPATAFVVVTGPAAHQLDDARSFAKSLTGMGIGVSGMIVNRWLQPALAADAALPAGNGGDPLAASVLRWGTRLEEVARGQTKALDAARRGAKQLYAVPIFDEDIHSIGGLRDIAACLGGLPPA